MYGAVFSIEMHKKACVIAVTDTKSLNMGSTDQTEVKV